MQYRPPGHLSFPFRVAAITSTYLNRKPEASQPAIHRPFSFSLLSTGDHHLDCLSFNNKRSFFKVILAGSDSFILSFHSFVRSTPSLAPKPDSGQFNINPWSLSVKLVHLSTIHLYVKEMDRNYGAGNRFDFGRIIGDPFALSTIAVSIVSSNPSATVASC